MVFEIPPISPVCSKTIGLILVFSSNSNAAVRPAGLTAAFELLEKTNIKPIVFEQTGDIGGISKTINYKGNRIDIGGHRFFSKSERVMKWWQNILPLQGGTAKDDIILKRENPLSKED